MSGTNFRNFPPLFDFFSSTLQFPHSTEVKSKQTRHAKVPACSIVLIVLRFGLLVFVGSVHSARMLTRPIDRRPGRPHQNGARSGRGCRGEGAHCGACQAQAWARRGLAVPGEEHCAAPDTSKRSSFRVLRMQTWWVIFKSLETWMRSDFFWEVIFKSLETWVRSVFFHESFSWETWMRSDFYHKSSQVSRDLDEAWHPVFGFLKSKGFRKLKKRTWQEGQVFSRLGFVVVVV